jgi:hypothetical protein
METSYPLSQSMQKPPQKGSKLSKLSFPGQHGPPSGLSLLAHNLPASYQLHTETLQRANLYPISLLHYTSLSSTVTPLSKIGQLPRLIVIYSPLVCPSFTWTTDSYITCYPVTHILFIALMMEAVQTSETSVHSNETIQHYIPEDSKLHTPEISHDMVLSEY